jgi:hypothetical protein
MSLYPLGEHKRTYDYLREAETLAEALEDQRRLGQVPALPGSIAPAWASPSTQAAVF